ncbi:MAG: aspartate/glutamate racemase family protein [Pseudomonadota bacterium]
MKEYYGLQAKIGTIFPTETVVIEPEFAAMAPEGVSVHSARVELVDFSLGGLSEMMDDERIETAAKMLGQRTPTDVVTFTGTSATFMRGIGYDEAVIKRMEAVMNKVPASTTSTAVLRALKTVGAKNISFVGPYDEQVTRLGAEFFRSHGFNVAGAHGMGLTDNLELNDVTLEQVYDYTKSVVDSGIDTLFISCTGLRTIGVIEDLETELGIPVVTSNQATFWDALRIAGVSTAKPGFGMLFDHMRH